MAQLNFNAQTVAPSTGAQEAIPAGWYNVAADESEMKPTKDASGAFLQIRFNILDGAQAGKKVYARLNLKNMNPVAVEIAYKDLSAICHATGVIQCDDSAMLHGKPLKVKVKYRPASADGQYEATNEINAYRNINDPTAVNATPGAPVAGVAALPGALPPFAAQPAIPVAAPPAQSAIGAPQPWAVPAAAAPATAQPAWNAAPVQAPAPAPVAPAPVTATPAAFQIPEGWTVHPQSAGYYYKGQEVLTEAQLKERYAAPAPVAAPAAPVAPAMPAAANPQAAVPPWAVPAAT